MAASTSPLLYGSTHSRIPKFARNAIRAHAAGIMVGPSCFPEWTSSSAVHNLLHGPSREAILVRRTWLQGFSSRLSGSATTRRQREEGDKGVATRGGRERRRPRGICSTTVIYSIGVRPCRAQQPSSRSQPFDLQSLTLNSSKKKSASHCHTRGQPTSTFLS